MRASLLFFALVIPSLTGCTPADHTKADVSTFAKRIECAKLATSDKWDDLISGPYLDSTFYSPSKDTCVFVMKETFPAEKDRNIQHAFFLVDALTRKQIWANDPKAGETEDVLTAKLNQELQKLQIVP